jgi:hypothetical protein
MKGSAEFPPQSPKNIEIKASKPFHRELNSGDLLSDSGLVEEAMRIPLVRWITDPVPYGCPDWAGDRSYWEKTFEGQTDSRRIEFENDSILRRIEAGAVSCCRKLESICLQPSVEWFHSTAFASSRRRPILVAEGNRHLRVSTDFLLSFDGGILISYVGKSSVVRIPREVEAICKEALMELSCPVEFETDSQLRRIEARAFADRFCLSPSCFRRQLTALLRRHLRMFRMSKSQTIIAISGFPDRFF